MGSFSFNCLAFTGRFLRPKFVHVPRFIPNSDLGPLLDLNVFSLTRPLGTLSPARDAGRGNVSQPFSPEFSVGEGGRRPDEGGIYSFLSSVY